ncbi:MAG: glycogen debranching enzyme N-terminal domain-containing protein [Chloroflexota bacterium]|nr:glycogen debranching enzyme N-terminal domain-containing protein [Chloroflexota bacterium]
MSMTSAEISLDAAVLHDLEAAIQREWLITNGIGGYASGTVTGINTRRYHGLLVAALDPPLGRTVMLAKVDEVVSVAGQDFAIGANEFRPDVIHPQGYALLNSFHLEGQVPVFGYNVGPSVLEKRIWMAHGRNTTYVAYTHRSGSEPLALTVRLFTALRDFHGLMRGSDHARPAVTIHDTTYATVTAHEIESPLHLILAEGGRFEAREEWYWNYVYRVERERALDFMEDLYHPVDFTVELAPGESAYLIASGEPLENIEHDAPRALRTEQERIGALLRQAAIDPLDDPMGAQLVVAADQFLVQRTLAEGERSLTVIAGYPWFGDWGRDAMISLPGLTLATNRSDAAKGLLRTFAAYVSEGMIPNRFPDVGEVPEYNTVDATLWYFQALHVYLEETRDYKLLRELLPTLKDIVHHYHSGTRYNIHVDPADGLVWAGEPGVQLTWMDVKAGDWLPTPRIGKPVEIQALWYNALRLLERWCNAAEEPVEEIPEWRALIEQHFMDRFWQEEGGHLYDVIDGPDGNDPALRPNQVLALSLPHALVPDDKARQVLDAVTETLLTPVGLRSLAPGDEQYRGHYGGSLWDREGSYHNGTVWGWLIGPYLDALLRYSNDTAAAKAVLQGLVAHMTDGALGTMSEVFDGDPPHAPRGCYAQAWSVAEVLRHWRALAV